jgi:hypothetical protein
MNSATRTWGGTGQHKADQRPVTAREYAAEAKDVGVAFVVSAQLPRAVDESADDGRHDA